MAASHIEFSVTGYEDVLKRSTEAGYHVIPMRDAFTAAAPTMILRHDVDFSIEHALSMARQEHRAGVCSSYYVMVTCDYYNVFSQTSRDALQEIVSLGHEVGLHWDSTFLPADAERHRGFFRAQLEMLSSASGAPVRSASQHIPTDTPPFDIGPYVQINAYSAAVNDRYTYVSDSSMVWRESTPLDLVAAGVDIQFLAHPIWWMADGSTQDEKIRATINGLNDANTSRSENYLDYMKTVLGERAKYDEYFRETR